MQHLMALNPDLMVKQVATGMHVDGGGTVFWGIVYSGEDPPSPAAGQGCPAGGRLRLRAQRVDPRGVGLGRGLTTIWSRTRYARLSRSCIL